mmetsp:Transcript_62061/g.147032  ORF Transcript_62061/g.147032 Transcript_62061/m.147032 type:complete len:117 (-) Transcript_62061:252-602(-)
MADSIVTFLEDSKSKNKFVIFDAPNDQNLAGYITALEKHNVSHVVRVCDSTYDKTPLERVGITVHDWPFPDGDAPPDEIIDRWLDLIRENGDKTNHTTACGIHCVAGLGRFVPLRF